MGLIQSIAGLDRKTSNHQDEIEAIASRIITHFALRSPIAEAYRTLRTNLTFSRPDNPCRTILVTSAVPREGKTTVVANLAITTAQTGTKTLIVDSDLRRPTQEKVFGLEKVDGLTDLLIGKSSLESLIQARPSRTCFCFQQGTSPPNPSELLASQRMKDLVFEISKSFEAGFFDSPPMIAVTDLAILSRNVDGVILVVQAGTTDREAVVRAKALLQNVQAKFLRIVLNNVKFEDTSHSL